MSDTWPDLAQAYNDLECCDKRRRMSIAAQELNDSIPSRSVLLLTKPLGASVFEMREHFGPGWRMYYLKRGAILMRDVRGRRQVYAGR